MNHSPNPILALTLTLTLVMPDDDDETMQEEDVDVATRQRVDRMACIRWRMALEFSLASITQYQHAPCHGDAKTYTSIHGEPRTLIFLCEQIAPLEVVFKASQPLGSSMRTAGYTRLAAAGRAAVGSLGSQPRVHTKKGIIIAAARILQASNAQGAQNPTRVISRRP